MNEKELLELKEKINSAKTKISELKGQKKQVLQTLKEKFKCSNADEAEEKIDDLAKELTILNERIENKSEQIEKTYPS